MRLKIATSVLYYCSIATIALNLFNVYGNDFSSFTTTHRADDFNARFNIIPLYGEVVEDGYSYARVYLGTPPQEFVVVVDTGSYLTFVPCTGCRDCGHHENPSFDPEKSSTYAPCDSQRSQCFYDIAFGESSNSSGVLAKDAIQFENGFRFNGVVFGCEHLASKQIKDQKADGIMGLSRYPESLRRYPKSPSLIDQLVTERVMSDSFSLCFAGMDGGVGAMVLGDFPIFPGTVFSYSDKTRSPYYNVQLFGIQVAGELLELDPSVFDQSHGTIVDSGCTFAYLPNEAFFAFKYAILSATKAPQITNATDNEICFHAPRRDASNLNKIFPQVKLVFGNNRQILSLSPENYLFRNAKIGAYCLGIYRSPRGDSTTILGGIIVRNTLVTYNRERSVIGFLKTDCNSLLPRAADLIGGVNNEALLEEM
ncbi:Eukaryotic aspartyl protease family protein [Euphorbia peplus]|nr:Eukaryotic aspartyl protease family protein [Euphorbia peplus]